MQGPAPVGGSVDAASLGAHQAGTIIAVQGLIAIAAAAIIWPELRRPPALPTDLL
jgi:hypothetical protein